MTDENTTPEPTVDNIVSDPESEPSDLPEEDDFDGLETVEPEPPDDISFDPPGDRIYHFGERCYYEYDDSDPDEDPDMQHVPFASALWPIETYEHVNDDEHGVRVAYRTLSGDLRHATLPAGHFATSRDQREGGKVLANVGVQVHEGQGKEVAEGLGRWLDERGGGAPHVYVTDTPGWKRKGNVYVNGTEVHGEETWYADQQRAIITRRSTRSGTLEQWQGIVDEHATTPGLRATLGVSLAGPLVGLLHDDPFIVHLCGASSSGKTTAARLAASVWGSTDAMVETWNSTVNGLENLCDVANGACLILDELGQFRGTREDLDNSIYNIADTTGRTRSTRSGDLREQRNWRLTGLSTGEISSSQMLGSYQKGGHAVRMIDVPIRSGDVTESGGHSDTLTRELTGGGRQGQYGEAGGAWIDYLLEVNPIELASLRDDYEHHLRQFDDGSPETGRILKEIALVGVALETANTAGLVSWGEGDALEATKWLACRAIEGREVTDPKRRMLRNFVETIDSKPQHFPDPASDDSPSRDVYGWRVCQHSKVEVWTAQSLLKHSGLCRESGVSPQNWISWAEDEGLCNRPGRERLPGRDTQKRWAIFGLEEMQRRL